MSDDIILKTSFRGFNKKAVMDYIEELQTENKRLTERLALLEDYLKSVNLDPEKKETSNEEDLLNTELRKAETAKAGETEKAVALEKEILFSETEEFKTEDDFDTDNDEDLDEQIDLYLQELQEEIRREEEELGPEVIPEALPGAEEVALLQEPAVRVKVKVRSLAKEAAAEEPLAETASAEAAPVAKKKKVKKKKAKKVK